MDRAARWLKQHSAAERSFARALRKYFQEQADRTGATVRENFPGGISPAMVPLAFDVNAEHEKLRPIVRRNLTGLLAMGAKAELAASERRLEAKDASDEYEELAALQLPPETLRGLQDALDQLEAQDYWLNIQNETATNLRQIIEDGIQAKLSNYSIGMRIREQLGGMAANKRAQKIARTEVTSAMNAGHVAAMQQLGAEGIVQGKQWLTIGDHDVRDTHQALANKTVRGVNATFDVGGYAAPYPGYFGLPAGERVHCRCTVISVFSDEVLTGVGADSPVEDAAAAP